MKTKFLFLSSAFLFLAFELSARTVVSLDGDWNTRSLDSTRLVSMAMEVTYLKRSTYYQGTETDSFRANAMADVSTQTEGNVITYFDPEVGRNYMWTVADSTGATATGHFYTMQRTPRVIMV